MTKTGLSCRLILRIGCRPRFPSPRWLMPANRSRPLTFHCSDWTFWLWAAVVSLSHVQQKHSVLHSHSLSKVMQDLWLQHNCNAVMCLPLCSQCGLDIASNWECITLSVENAKTLPTHDCLRFFTYKYLTNMSQIKLLVSASLQPFV